MALERLTRIATLSLGALYLAAGITKTAEAASTGAGGPAFLFGTLIGGGALVLAGLALTTRQPHIGRTMVCIGSVLGILATAWTVVMPVLAMIVVFLTLRETARDDRQPE